MSGITHTRSATTSPTLPTSIIVSSNSPSNQSTNTSPKKVTYQTDERLSTGTRQSIDLSNMPTIITTKPPPSVPITDLLKNNNQSNQPTTTLCFICELPILSHQCWSSWSNNNASSPGLLTVSGVAAASTDEYSGLNSIHHEDCLTCSICNVRLKPGSGSKRHGNRVYCPLHYADVSGLGSGGEEFLAKLRDFKRQSLGCAEARRKSSTTLTFPIPVQACPGHPYCSGFPHYIKQTTGYWTECGGGTEMANLANETASGNQTQAGGDLKLGSDQLLIPTPGIPRSNTSSDGLLSRPRLERNDTSKSTNDMGPTSILQPPTICIENLTRDDIELYTKKQPNIIITIASSVSPPTGSPPETPAKDAKSSIGTSQSKGQQSTSAAPTSTANTVTVAKQTEQEFAIQQLEQFKLAAQKGKQPGDPQTSIQFTSSQVVSNQMQISSQGQISAQQLISTTTTMSTTTAVTGADESAQSSELMNINLPTSMPQANKQEQKDEFELISFQEEIYEKHFYGKEHWNYFTSDDGLGSVIMSLKQEIIGGRDQFRVLLRTVSYTLHGLVPASSICADRYDREAVVRAFSKEAGLNPVLQLGQLPSTSDELLKLDQVFVKSELKVGVLYVKHGQTTEEQILGNKEESPAFKDFLSILGEKVRLKGFDKYKGGLDTVHDLTGKESVYTNYRGIEIMFHVSTMLPHEENDPQKLQKKRHIGNDIVCCAFVESDSTLFIPSCIKSHFLHAFIVVRTSPADPSSSSPKPRKYKVSVVCRDEVMAFKPYLWHESVFESGERFRKWLLAKIINGERASYSAPKFARMQDRTRTQMLEDIVNNLANHLATGQIPKPYRRGSWRPIGHMRPSSPLLDSVRDLFEGYDQLSKDFSSAFNMNSKMICDVVFNVIGGSSVFARNNPGHQNASLAALDPAAAEAFEDKNGKNGNNSNFFSKSQHCIYCGLTVCQCTHQPEDTCQSKRIFGVRAILAIRSRVFLEMLYGFTTIGNTSQSHPVGAQQPQANAGTGAGGDQSTGEQANLSAEQTGQSGKRPEPQQSPEKPNLKGQSIKRKRGSITAETMHKIAQIPKIIYPSSESKSKQRKDSEFSSASMHTSKPLSYLTVPSGGQSASNTQTDQQIPTNISNNLFNPNQQNLNNASSTGLRAVFTRFLSGYSGWGSKSSRNDPMKRWQSESLYYKQDNALGVELPGLSVCADIAKIDRNKLAQTEFTIMEFDGDTFQLLIEYLHSGTCPLTCTTIPGLICASEHFDIPDLLQACFHHTKTHLHLRVVPDMLSQLENYYWRYNCASQLASAILKYIDGKLLKLFQLKEYLQLSESMLISIMSRPSASLSELQKFEIMLKWAQAKVSVSPILRNKSPANWNTSEVSANLNPVALSQLKQIMSRLSKKTDIKFYKMSPSDIIKVVLPSKTISNEQIVSTLLYQADAGLYNRNADFTAFTRK